MGRSADGHAYPVQVAPAALEEGRSSRAFSDIPGGTFPDYALPDHTGTVRTLSELQGRDPLILTLARGNYCPKEHRQHLELAENYAKIAVAYTQVATIATDDHHTLQEFRASVGAQWPFLSDPERIVQKDLGIQEYTDPDHNPMIPYTLVLKPGLVIQSIYNGYWFWGRPRVNADLVCRAKQGVTAMRTGVCELLGIEQPIVLAPMVAVPSLAAAVSNAGALGMVTLTRGGAAGGRGRRGRGRRAGLGGRAEEMPIHEDYRRRLIAAAETDPQRYPNLYSVGWPDSPHRALRNSTADAWQAAGRPLAQRPGAGDVIAHFASGEPIVRYEPAPPMAGTTGDIEALSMWAGQSVALARKSQPAADIVTELTSHR